MIVLENADFLVKFLYVIAVFLILGDMLLVIFIRYLMRATLDLYVQYDLLMIEKGLKDDKVTRFIEEKKKEYAKWIEKSN